MGMLTLTFPCLVSHQKNHSNLPTMTPAEVVPQEDILHVKAAPGRASGGKVGAEKVLVWVYG